MLKVSTYLNYTRQCEEAFKFYKSVFGGEFGERGLQRFRDFPLPSGHSELRENEKDLIIHVELPLPGGFILMGSDVPESMGMKVIQGNNYMIALDPDSREETKRIFDALSSGGQITMPLQDMFWGGYYGSLIDKFGIHWMVNHSKREA